MFDDFPIYKPHEKKGVCLQLPFLILGLANIPLIFNEYSIVIPLLM